MNARRAIIGLCAICALLISAFAAQGASAAGTTAYTCRADAAVKNKGNADCSAAGTTFGHTAIPANTKTELSGSGGKSVLKATIAGAGIEVTAETVSAGAPLSENTMENKEEKNAAGETVMVAHGEGRITYNNVTVNLPNCTVVGITAPGGAGMITTTKLTATTLDQGDSLLFKPASTTNTIFAEFELVGASCSVNGLKITVTGSVTGVPSGANVVFTHAETTTQNKLKANGSKAGIEGTLTLTARANSTQAFTPISPTT